MGDNNIKNQRHELITERNSRRYVFRYDCGLEHEVMSQLLEMIFDDRIDFDWSDAALISFGLIDNLIKEKELSQNDR